MPVPAGLKMLVAGFVPESTGYPPTFLLHFLIKTSGPTVWSIGDTWNEDQDNQELGTRSILPGPVDQSPPVPPAPRRVGSDQANGELWLSSIHVRVSDKVLDFQEHSGNFLQRACLVGPGIKQLVAVHWLSSLE